MIAPRVARPRDGCLDVPSPSRRHIPDLTGAQHGAAREPARRSSAPTASGCPPRRPPGTTSPGCASSGADRSCSRASCRVDDAKRAVDAGVTAISVSNHGGNNLDGTPAAIRALPPIADAVGDQVEVVLDGGIRRGSDVVKAVALGARAVMIGRAYLWGLAANGQAGVENVLDDIAGEQVFPLVILAIAFFDSVILEHAELERRLLSMGSPGRPGQLVAPPSW